MKKATPNNMFEMSSAVRLLLFVTLLFCSGIAVSQPTNPPTDPDQPVPITGIELLIGAGALLGSKKILQRKGK